MSVFSIAKSCIIKISDNQCFVFPDLPSNIVYFCVPCFHKLPSAIKANNNVYEMFPLIEKKLESMETALVNKLISLNDQTSELLKRNSSKTLESQITTITNQNQAAISDLAVKVWGRYKHNMYMQRWFSAYVDTYNNRLFCFTMITNLSQLHNTLIKRNISDKIVGLGHLV